MIQTLFGTPEPGFFDKMKQAVARTRENLSERIDDIVSIGKEIDRNSLDELEAILITADLGAKTTNEILENLRDRADRKQIKDVSELKRLIKEQILEILNSTPPRLGKASNGEAEVGRGGGGNGTGKTTTIGKLAHALRSEGKTVLLCAADTFRAAAIEQLEVWGSRTGVEVIKTKPGGDPSAVLFDTLNAAKPPHTHTVILDTPRPPHTTPTPILD